MSSAPFRGVFPILVTPFDDHSRVDEESLAHLVDFAIENGVHGLGIALGSEIPRLSESERRLVARLVVRQVAGRVPVVINTGGAGTDLAVLYSRTAEEDGADALMVMTPLGGAAVSGPEAREYYRHVSGATRLPIFIQDTASTPVAGALARQIAQECEHVQYVKVECPPMPARVADTVAQVGDRLVVFGGAGGSYLLEELRRGSVGTMPFCSQPEAFVKVWDLYQAGDVQGARRAFNATIAPVNHLSGSAPSAFFHVHKEILRRRGVISTSVVRGPIAPLDDLTRRELDELIEQLYGA
jgi:dihydrodipicolinate synthase/N-acetylneuraminate lyase